jgi:hypothetical protein
MQKIKTITVDGVTYSVETDVSDKADLVDGVVPENQLPPKADLVEGKLPYSQLPTTLLSPRLIKSNSQQVDFVSYNYSQDQNFDFKLPKGVQDPEDPTSSGSFVLWLVPREKVEEDWSIEINSSDNPSNQGYPVSTIGCPSFTFGYYINPEESEIRGWFFSGGESTKFLEGNILFYSQSSKLYVRSVYKCDFYIICSIT